MSQYVSSEDAIYMNKKEHSWEIFCYVLIVSIVILFSLKSLGIRVIVLDDLAHYLEAVTGKFGYSRLRRTLVNPVVWYFFAKVMSFSPALSRTIILSLVIIPVSILIFYLCHRHLGLPRSFSIFCAVFPHVLPGQTFIPTFIVGSYNTWALLIYLLSTLLWMRYLGTGLRRYLLAGIISYFAALEATETVIFLTAPLAILLWRFARSHRSYLIAVLSVSVLAVYKIIFVITNPFSDVNRPHFYNLSIVIERTKKLLCWSLPNPGISDSIFLSLYFFVIVLGFAFFVAKPVPIFGPSRKIVKPIVPRSERWQGVWLYLFGLSWMGASILPFIASKYFSSRYAYLLGFGSNFILVLATYSLLWRGRLRKIHAPTLLLAILVLMAGLNRVGKIKKTFTPAEQIHASIERSLRDYKFPKGSQLVIVGGQTGYLLTGGYWIWSSGYIKYATKRNDLCGLVGKEQKFYDPFNPRERSYHYHMHGLDKSAPIFLFRYNKGDLKPLYYCLQWKDGNEHLEWNIYRLTLKGGSLHKIFSGRTEAEYKQAIESLKSSNIHKKDILWAG